MFTHTFANGTKTATVDPTAGTVTVTPSGRTFAHPCMLDAADGELFYKPVAISLFQGWDFNRIEEASEWENPGSGALGMRIAGNSVTFKRTGV